MRPRARYGAFAGALLAFGAAAALIAALFDGPEGSATSTTASAVAPKGGHDAAAPAPRQVAGILRRRAAGSSRSEDVRSRRAVPAGVRAANEAALSTFKRFAPAYLRYEVGDADPAVRRILARTASEQFAHELLASPPRVPPTLGRAPRASLEGEFTVTPLGPVSQRYSPVGPTRRIQVEALARRGGRVERLAFVLELSAGGWRVTAPAGG